MDKVAKGRMRGGMCLYIQQFPLTLTLTLSLRERGLFLLHHLDFGDLFPFRVDRMHRAGYAGVK